MTRKERTKEKDRKEKCEKEKEKVRTARDGTMGKKEEIKI